MKGDTMSETKTYLAHNIEKTAEEARYDANAKSLIADKQVLARIAKYCTSEFKNYDIPTIIECIEGEPEISNISVYPGKTSAIHGMNTESKISGEGEITFDVRFHMLTKSNEQIKVILNIELQNKYYQTYHFEPRAVFYCARMLSEQLDREFTTDNYDDLKKVYSIWIFFNAPQKDSDTITEFSLSKRDVYGKPIESHKYDYISISFIRLSIDKSNDSKHTLINMLNTLFSDELSSENKKKILKEEHHMHMTRELEGGIDTMCNVSQGIKEKAYDAGVARGLTQGIAQGISQGKLDTYLELLRDGLLSISDVAHKLNITEQEVQKMLSQ